MNPDSPVFYFDTAVEWRAWLAENGQNEAEIWLGLYKKDSKQAGISYEDSVKEALCYGWIDGLTKRVDDDSYKIRFSPRKAKGNWAASNIARVEALIQAGKMTPFGMIHIESAKADGRWPTL